MAKGHKTGGRQKGTPNKVSRALKDAILEAANLAGDEEGLVGYLKQQAKLNPGPFLALLGKVLPTTLAGDPDAPLEMINRIERAIVPAVQDAADQDAADIPTTH